MMKDIYVIFDTNVYRDLTYGLTEHEARDRFEKIKRAEIERGIFAGLSVVTAMELMAHLADKSDPAYELCKIAITAAGFHVLRDKKEVSYFLHPQLQLQNLIIGDYDEVLMSKFEIIMEVVNFINIGPAEDYIVKFHEQIAEVKRLVGLHEQDFKNTIFNIVKGLDPSTTSWTALANDREKRKRTLKYLIDHQQEVLDLMAIGYVHKTLTARGKQWSRQETALAAIKVADYFRTALMLHLAVFKKIVIGGFDMDNRKLNRENTIWDIYHLFGITDGQVGGKDVVFVTAENWLHEISLESGLAEKILKVEDYLDKIGVTF